MRSPSWVNKLKVRLRHDWTVHSVHFSSTCIRPLFFSKRLSGGFGVLRQPRNMAAQSTITCFRGVVLYTSTTIRIASSRILKGNKGQTRVFQYLNLRIPLGFHDQCGIAKCWWSRGVSLVDERSSLSRVLASQRLDAPWKGCLSTILSRQAWWEEPPKIVYKSVMK